MVPWGPYFLTKKKLPAAEQSVFKRGILSQSFGPGQKRYPKELLPQRFRRTFGVNFLVRFASKPLVLLGSALELFRNSLVLFVRSFGFGVLFWLPTFGPLIEVMANRRLASVSARGAGGPCWAWKHPPAREEVGGPRALQGWLSTRPRQWDACRDNLFDLTCAPRSVNLT